MVIKPLNIRTVRNLPLLRRVLASYELGTRVEDIARIEGAATHKRVYKWLSQARRLREAGRLGDTEPG